MTNFQCVKAFNRAFDMVSKEPKEYIGYDEDIHGFIKINPYKYCRTKAYQSHSLMRLRLNLIKEEIGELNDAIKVNDMKEMRDAIGDILYVVYGMADILGIDIDHIFRNTIEDEVQKYYIDNPKDKDKDKDKDNNNINIIIVDKIISSCQTRYSNFNYTKLFFNELIDDKKCKDVLDKINDLYSKLEKECEPDIIYEDSNNKYSIEKKIIGLSYIIYNLLKWTYIFAHMNIMNADSDFAIIHESNMSKLCDTEQDAKDTVMDYENKYKSGNSPYDSPYYYDLPELGKWIVKNKSSGKALKNIKYKAVIF
jgi:NTP pyrophosphatase (non-canonical NTP hydrolase)